MGTFTKTRSVLDNQYSYVNESLMIAGNYILDAATNALINVSGSVFVVGVNGNQGDFIGSFNGSMDDDKMSYSFSQMTKEQSDLVWVAVKEIEPYILGEENKE
jgi:hypothetical protein